MGAWALAWLILWPVAACAAAGTAAPYAKQLMARARHAALAERPRWHALLHYRANRILPGVTSEVDSPGFFLAPHGKTDPAAELDATIASFFAPPPRDADTQHPQCRFIARYHWLKAQLHFDPARLPERPCARFHKWLNALNPKSVTLIFPTAYLNNPSSMFGHTLLRIDAKGQGDQTRLLAYAVNYAASTGRDGGVLFAFKGLFGWYPGVFSVAPYYLRVREYNDIENRDIWEYRLNLSEAEIRFMLMHLWELRRSFFYYYFFDENCSYHLLGLLDVARPGLGLTDRFRGWVIPAETVRTIVKQSGLVERVVYRPSRRTVLQWRMNQLNGRERREVERLADGTLTPRRLAGQDPPAHRRGTLLEDGYELLNYKRVTGQIDKQRAKDLGYRLLAARSALDYRAAPAHVPAPAVRPDQGHRPPRITLGIGRADRRWVQDIQLRLAYHDLLDPPGGYVRGAQIQFMDFTVRRFSDTGTVRVEHGKAIDIVSLTPVSDLKRPVSWKINIGIIRHHLTQYDNPLDMHLNGGGGFTWQPLHRLMTYLMLDGTVDAGPGLNRSYSVGIGPEAGLVADFSGAGRLMATAHWLRFGLGDYHTRQTVSLAQRTPLGKHGAVELNLSRVREFHRAWNQISLRGHYYF
ncbi:MAG TPA: DUF4105 domain-containing protein [Gammaproteobacteria bacterium]|nr:DUF4105 domain-containing protein [Gammaproteobacteria bacterium]